MVSAMDLPLDAAPHERYVFKPSFGSSHYWALGALSADRVAGKRVLDIGAGGGGMGQRLRAFSPSALAAIEVDPQAAAALRGTYDEVAPSLDAYSGRSFDVVLLLDVLEHMADPFEFLHRLPSVLAPGARVLISVPNVAHWSVRFPLFFLGRFEYRSRGLLDRTHLQFFSRRRFRALCEALPGCGVLAMGASIEPVELILPAWATRNPLFGALSRVRAAVAHALPGLMGYQHLAELRFAGS